MDRFYLLRPEGLGLNHPGDQVTQVVVTSFELSRQRFNRLLIRKFKRTAKSVRQYFLTQGPAKAIFFRTEQVALQILHTLELMPPASSVPRSLFLMA